MIKLDIGCGVKETTKEGFTGVDAYAKNAEIKADMWDLPFAEGEVDEIYSAQALEHVSKFQVVPTLIEWKRVLKIGGKIEVRVPDLEWACMWWLLHQATGWNMDIIYGLQTHDGEYHKTGFSTKILWDYFQEVKGFDVHSVEYEGGKSELQLQMDGIKEDIDQRVIVLKATRIAEDA